MLGNNFLSPLSCVKPHNKSNGIISRHNSCTHISDMPMNLWFLLCWQGIEDTVEILLREALQLGKTSSVASWFPKHGTRRHWSAYFFCVSVSDTFAPSSGLCKLSDFHHLIKFHPVWKNTFLSLEMQHLFLHLQSYASSRLISTQDFSL